MRHADHHDGGNRAGLPQIMRNAPISFSLGGKGSRPHIGVMHLDLTDKEAAALTQELRMLIEENSLRYHGGSCAVTAKGLLAAEALQTPGSNPAQGFVAMSFDPNLNDAWTNGFDPGIRTAGLRPVRIDKQDYIGGISDR